MMADGVTNIYLYNTLKNSIKCSNLFVGVFSSDNMNVKKLKMKEEFILICNLSPQKHAGTHFVTIVANKREILYCDSLALPINTSNELFSNLKNIRKKVTNFIKHPIQASLSNFCGIYCMYFVALFDHKRFPHVIYQKKFVKHHLKKNDFICVNNLKELLMQNT